MVELRVYRMINPPRWIRSRKNIPFSATSALSAVNAVLSCSRALTPCQRGPDYQAHPDGGTHGEME